jgi:hypothetical protein
MPFAFTRNFGVHPLSRPFSSGTVSLMQTGIMQNCRLASQRPQTHATHRGGCLNGHSSFRSDTPDRSSIPLWLAAYAAGWLEVSILLVPPFDFVLVRFPATK